MSIVDPMITYTFTWSRQQIILWEQIEEFFFWWLSDEESIKGSFIKCVRDIE